MTRLIVAAFAAALVSSAQAFPLASPQPDDTLTLVRDACGAGMHRVNGVCVRTPARHDSAVRVEPYLLSEAARMREMQKYWPNEPLCDDGGYRIRPCYLSPGRGR